MGASNKGEWENIGSHFLALTINIWKAVGDRPTSKVTVND